MIIRHPGKTSRDDPLPPILYGGTSRVEYPAETKLVANVSTNIRYFAHISSMGYSPDGSKN
jgi:hypothetical protein